MEPWKDEGEPSRELLLNGAGASRSCRLSPADRQGSRRDDVGPLR
jgi:hypothetical protein